MVLRPDFAAQRDRSRIYEIAVGAWLQAERGYFILPSYDYSGLANDKAPRLECGRDKLVLPDLLAFHPARQPTWFEVKLKARADLYRKTNTLETGMATRHLQDYRRVKTLTRMQVWVFFVHELEEMVVTSEIDELPVSHSYTGTRMDRGGTTFFDFNKLKLLMPLQELQRYCPPTETRHRAGF